MTYDLTIGAPRPLDGVLVGATVRVTAPDHDAAYYDGARALLGGPAPKPAARRGGRHGYGVRFALGAWTFADVVPVP